MEKMKLRLDLNDDQMERIKKQRTETLEKMKTIRENSISGYDEKKSRDESIDPKEKRKHEINFE